jgi:hypothetical protein
MLRGGLEASGSNYRTLSGRARRQSILLHSQPGALVRCGRQLCHRVTYFTVDGMAVKPRRQVVSQANCTRCHNTLMLHGGIRQNVILRSLPQPDGDRFIHAR